MHSLLNSIRKRWHTLTASPRTAQRKWSEPYWTQRSDWREVACRGCPQFQAAYPRCAVSFGTPLRKCVVSSVEAHLHDGQAGEQVLEVGYGRFSLGRRLLQRRGAAWTGIDPLQAPDKPTRLGRGGFGHAAHIPFANATFDRVFGVQTLEHWGQKSFAAARSRPSDYRQCLQEIARVLKPGGRIYFDAPLHFHGHEMFIVGDIAAVRALFDSALWVNLVVERWRHDYAPLERYASPKKLYPEWEQEITSYDAATVAQAKQQPICLLTVTAQRT